MSPLAVYRVQDAAGRGPWRPGFSHLWVRDRDDHDNLLPSWKQFGVEVLQQTPHVGCGCRTLEQLRRWFAPEEYADLLGFGYQAVCMEVDRVLAESPIQLVFQRRRALRFGAEPVNLYALRAAMKESPHG